MIDAELALDLDQIFEEGADRPWTLQGLGMLRTYLPGNRRLHIWHPDFATSGVTDLHTHPWDFESQILLGEVHQNRFTETLDLPENYVRQAITCGPGGGVCGGPEPVYLEEGPGEVYAAGESYRQEANEIHRSQPLRGTVTLLDRTVRGDGETAYVFWRAGSSWVSAEPRPAARWEVDAFLDAAREWMT